MDNERKLLDYTVMFIYSYFVHIKYIVTVIHIDCK